MTAAELQATIRSPSPHAPETSLVCVENTHNGAGGVVTPVEELQAIRAVANELRVPVHMDGARLWNAHIATGTALDAFGACADSVMVSFSKGLGAPVGAALAGSAEFIRRAHRVRKRFGGGMRQSGVLAAAALHGLEHHLAGLADDHRGAKVLAAALDGAAGATVVPPDTNIVMCDLPGPWAADVVAAAAAQGVLISPWTKARVRAVVHRDAPGERVVAAGVVLRDVIVAVSEQFA
jgi:threonine aldolase